MILKREIPTTEVADGGPGKLCAISLPHAGHGRPLLKILHRIDGLTRLRADDEILPALTVAEGALDQARQTQTKA